MAFEEIKEIYKRQLEMMRDDGRQVGLCEILLDEMEEEENASSLDDLP